MQFLFFISFESTDIMRNVTWNCAPENNESILNAVDSNDTAQDIELQSCQNNGKCVAYELTDAQDEVQRGFECQCTEGFM